MDMSPGSKRRRCALPAYALVAALSLAGVGLGQTPVSAGSKVDKPGGLIHSSGSAVVVEERVGNGMVYAELEDGTALVAPEGSKVVSTSAVRSNAEGQRGRSTEVTLQPPEPTDSSAVPAQGAAGPQALRLAVEKGVIPADLAQEWIDDEASGSGEVSVQSHYSGGTFFDSGCLRAENKTGYVHGC